MFCSTKTTMWVEVERELLFDTYIWVWDSDTRSSSCPRRWITLTVVWRWDTGRPRRTFESPNFMNESGCRPKMNVSHDCTSFRLDASRVELPVHCSFGLDDCRVDMVVTLLLVLMIVVLSLRYSTVLVWMFDRFHFFGGVSISVRVLGVWKSRSLRTSKTFNFYNFVVFPRPHQCRCHYVILG